MKMYRKDIADRLFREGKMPEWWYRQNYKTFDENWIELHQQGQQELLDFLEKRRQKMEEAELEKSIDKTAKEAIEKHLGHLFNS